MKTFPNVMRIAIAVLVTAAFALSLGSGVCLAKEEKTATSTGKTFATRAPDTKIRRFAEIRPGLSRGGEPYDKGLEYLHAKGYRTVLSFLNDQDESTRVVGLGMKYINIPMRSGPFSAQPPTDDQVRRFLTVVQDTSLYPLYIHCHAGKDRTGAMTAIYRMESCGWTKDEAIEEMRAFGFAGRYKRLFNFVRDYTPGRVGLTPDTTMAVTKSRALPAVPASETR